MTVIAYDGRYVAADKMATNNGNPQTVTKLWPWGEKVIAITGDYAHGLACRAWLIGGCGPNDFPPKNGDRYAFMAVFERGKNVLVYEAQAVPSVFEDQRWAGGCGRDLALASMHCGRTPTEAVEIASIYDINCGKGVDVIDLWELKGEPDRT